MKKFLIFLVLALSMTSCSSDEEKEDVIEVRKLYEVLLPSYKGVSTYVIRAVDGRNLYLVRWRLGTDLQVGDQITIETSRFCSSEISKVNGIDVKNPESENETKAVQTKGLITSDPIETDIKDIFSMEFIQVIPMVPVPCYCIEDEHGDLLIVNKKKVSTELKIGDRIVYNYYTLFPNEVLMLKKLRG